mmetsp:Transcript_7530/g.8245  ORF Transcript_7530/g.8245 Transcript_7530/m.8245 type:complete len:590 (-) Transcript_7530:146-1915(-)
MKRFVALLLAYIAVIVLSKHPNDSYHIRFVTNTPHSKKCTIVVEEYVPKYRGFVKEKKFNLESSPQIISHDTGVNGGKVYELYATTKHIATRVLHRECKVVKRPAKVSLEQNADEVIPIVETGEPSNRIDLVFMGDGYTQSEREEMLDDMKRLIDDMFNGVTFADYLPLFNVWVVFRPSVESGIGVGGKPLNTAFGLYRSGTELRGVYTSKASAARDACKQTGPQACDYPTLIGNSPYYGGLGGEFAISTESPTSGTIVLRHELGHNFGKVGEEYDGGSAYNGANYASSLTQAASKWGHWLTDRPPVVAQDAQLRLQAYPWYLLKGGPISYKFESNGQYKRWLLDFTISGCPEEDSLIVLFDGEPLDWKSHGEDDRTFYQYEGSEGFSSGEHTLEFKQAYPGSGPIERQLCSLTLHEYMDAPQFHWEDYIGAYKTYRLGNTLAGYRPMNEYCLMRNMSSPHFCPVDVENMWLRFFAVVNLIDDIEADCGTADITVTAKVVQVAQFRKEKNNHNEELTITWTRNGQPYPAFDGMFTWTAPRNTAVATWRATVVFKTDQIRSDPNNLTVFTKEKVVSFSDDCNNSIAAYRV